MNKLDRFLMDLSLHMKILFYKLLFFAMFRKKANCKHFCLTCSYFDKCMEDVKEQYRIEKLNQNQV